MIYLKTRHIFKNCNIYLKPQYIFKIILILPLIIKTLIYKNVQVLNIYLQLLKICLLFK